MSMFRICQRFGGGFITTLILKRFYDGRWPLEVLDHSSPLPTYGSKVGIDATKSSREGHNRDWPEN